MKEKIEYIRKFLPKDKWNDGEKLLKKGVSPQYIVGNVNFYGNIIKVILWKYKLSKLKKIFCKKTI